MFIEGVAVAPARYRIAIAAALLAAALIVAVVW